MNYKIIYIALASLLATACGGGSHSAPPVVNQAPQISAISDQNISANKASQPISFTVSDEQISSLSFTLVSDNTDVIANDSLTLDGSGANRTLTVTPLSDTTGNSFVTIMVTDSSGLAASTTFLLNVDPQQQSMQLFARSSFDTEAEADPELVNAVEFTQDADDDDFADLLEP